MRVMSEIFTEMMDEYDWTEIPVGRWGKADRKMFLLSDKEDHTCKLAVKILELKTQLQKKQFTNEIKILNKAATLLPTRFLEAKQKGKCAVIITRCLPDATSWDDPGLTRRAFRRGTRAIIRQIHDLHKMNIMHNDLTQKNLMINPKGEAGLIDFEDAVEFIEGEPSIRYRGSPKFFSPKKDWSAFFSNFTPISEEDLKSYESDEETYLQLLENNDQNKELLPIVWEVFVEEGFGLQDLTREMQEVISAFI